MNDRPTLDTLAGRDLGTRRVDFDDVTVILYALAVGADPGDLDLVFERDLRPLPTLACALGLWAVETAGALGTYDPTRSLHARQLLTMHRPLPAAGPIEMTGQVTNVFDKGKAALVEIQAASKYFTATYGIFLPGLGGWGGDRGPSAGPAAEVGYSATQSMATARNLAAIYRLTGDRHPIHIDPAVAAANGFERPILHGLCSVGIAARLAARSAGAHPADLTDLDVRLSAPVLPGDTVVVDTQGDGNRVLFQARVDQAVVLAGGQATFAGPLRP